MLNWFRRKSGQDRDLERELQSLEDSARAATGQVRGHLLNQAGDLAAGAELRDQALLYYGRAVDTYLLAQGLAPAAAVCRKILRLAPDTVRAHCTLACLAIQDRRLGDPFTELDQYVRAARRRGTVKLAIARLRLMAGALEEEPLLRAIAEHLAAVGDGAGSRRILSGIAERGDAIRTPRELRWRKLTLAAMHNPDELWKHA